MKIQQQIDNYICAESIRHQPKMQKYLLIQLETYEISEDSALSEQLYYSFGFNNYMYFTSSINTRKSMPIMLNDHILIALGSGNQNQEIQNSHDFADLPDFIQLNRWEAHMIMFTHNIDITDLKTRVSVRKKYETNSGEVLGFVVTILNPGEIQFGNKYIQSISQHYLTIQNFSLTKAPKKPNKDPYELSYMMVKTSAHQYVMPVMDGQICIKLPETLEFMHIINHKVVSKSKLFTSDELRSKQTRISLSSVSNLVNDQSISVDLQWGINLQEEKPITNLLLQAHEIMLYDIELKLESTQEITNGRLKVIYGNKGFEVHNFEGSASKSIRVKKIVLFMIKSEDEQFHIVLEKNSKVISAIKIYTQDISIFGVMNLRKKFQGGKSHQSTLGSIRFKCEKGKNLSHPSNNKYWKQCLSLKKKIPLNSFLLSIQQVSIRNEREEPLDMVIKSQSQSSVISQVPNLEYFNPDLFVDSVPYIFTVREEDNIYMMLKVAGVDQYEEKSQDFLGIALLNFNELRLGLNIVNMPFYLNHKETGNLQCLVNKIAPFTFIKSIFQPELAEVNRYAHKTIGVSMEMKKVEFSPYYYTYQYENKNQLYCIVEINRLKRVLIMNDKSAQQILHKHHNMDLFFTPAASSDKLNFVIDETEQIKIRITFLISDLGREEEIYGVALAKIKTSDIYPEFEGEAQQSPKKKKKSHQKYTVEPNGVLVFKSMQLTNSYGLIVGQISFTVQQGTQNLIPASKVQQSKLKNYVSRTPQPEINLQYKLDSSRRQKPSTGPFNSEIKRVRNDIDIINKNMQSIEKELSPEIEAKKPQKSRKIIKEELSMRKMDRYPKNVEKEDFLLEQYEVKMRKKYNKGDAVNPIRNAILNHSIDIRKDIRYDNSIDYGKNRRKFTQRQSVKLPSLKKQPAKKGSLQQLVRLMQIRKKGRNGQYIQTDTVNSSSKDDSFLLSKRKKKEREDGPSLQQINSVEKIERENPNIKRNMEILFPSKTKAGRSPPRYKANGYDQKLKGLKSVMGEISQDMDEIQPDTPERNEQQEKLLNSQKYTVEQEIQINEKRDEPINLNSAEFEDNQFAMEMDI